MRAVLRSYLESFGFSVTEAPDGLVALEVLDRTGADGVRFDVLIVDWNMPVLDGFSFVKQVRQQRRLSAVPVLMVSAESDAFNISRALLAGVDEYASKPVTREQLHSKLALLGLLND